MAVDDGGNILIGDMYNHRIQKFTSDGKFITAVGKEGSKPLEFNTPLGIAIHPLNKKVYIADSDNHRVHILNSDLTFSSNGRFLNLWDLAFDNSGNVYVADLGNHNIQVFTEEGEFLRKFGKTGKSIEQLNRPSSISIDSDNAVYVTQCGKQRVSVFTCEGKFLTSFGTKGTGPGQFDYRCGITVDENGVVYVSDTDNHRLQLF